MQVRTSLTLGQSAENVGKPWGLLSGHEHSQDVVGLQAAQGEGQSLHRERVGPLDVVDDDGHGSLVLKTAQQVEQLDPRSERVAAGPAEEHPILVVRTGVRHQLGDHASRQTRLILVSGGEEHAKVRNVAEDLPDKRGLAHPCGALDGDEGGRAGTGLVEVRD